MRKIENNDDQFIYSVLLLKLSYSFEINASKIKNCQSLFCHENKICEQEYLKWKYAEPCFSMNITECVLKPMGYFLYLMFLSLLSKISSWTDFDAFSMYMHVKKSKLYRKIKNATKSLSTITSVYDQVCFQKYVRKRFEV